MYLYTIRTSGFLCTNCPKLYPLSPVPPPAPSSSPAQRKTRRNKAVPITSGQILRQRAQSRRRSRESAKLAGTLEEDGVRIRGRWMSTREFREPITICTHPTIPQLPGDRMRKPLVLFTTVLMGLTVKILRTSQTLVSALLHFSLINNPTAPPIHTWNLTQTR